MRRRTLLVVLAGEWPRSRGRRTGVGQCGKGQVVLYFLGRGELINKVTLGQVQAIGGLSKLTRTESHYRWGHPVGFDQEGYFVIETIAEDSQQGDARRANRFDASKGEPLIPAPSK
jgi:hypothetical protein